MCSGLEKLEGPQVGLLEIEKLGGVFVDGERQIQDRINVGFSEEAAEVGRALLEAWRSPTIRRGL